MIQDHPVTLLLSSMPVQNIVIPLFSPDLISDDPVASLAIFSPIADLP
jgi:hypothetical protein